MGDHRKLRQSPSVRGKFGQADHAARFESSICDNGAPNEIPKGKTERNVATTSPVTDVRTKREPKAPRRSRALQPEPTDVSWDDPDSFHEALALHMRRHRDTCENLRLAILEPGETLERSTIGTWRSGRKAPQSAASIKFLGRIERRYRLPKGYFKAKLPHLARAASWNALPGISAAQQRNIAWHLPDDFRERSDTERKKILEWVRDVIISRATDFRRYHANVAKHRYGLRFSALLPRKSCRIDVVGDVDDKGQRAHPKRLSLVAEAPSVLAEEMAELVAFKSSTLTPFGYQRRGVWSDGTARQRMEHLGMLFGALAAPPRSVVQGHGVPLNDLTFGLLVFPAVWDWYVQWRGRRRGFYTVWEFDMLGAAAALTHDSAGWITQSPKLAERLSPVRGLISADDIERVRSDWPAACAAAHAHAKTRAKDIQRVARVHRDPFEAILPVLESDSPAGEYRRIADEILRLMPNGRRYPRAHAEAVRSLLLIRFGLHLGLRQRNLRELLVCPRGQTPSTERQLEERRRGELRWSERDKGWEVLVPAAAFKNSYSSFFAGKPFRLVLPDLCGLYAHIDAWIGRHRQTLIGRAKDPGTFFVKTVRGSTIDAAYGQGAFYWAWRLTIQRYGVFNPYTGRGAIRGLLPHGPHAVRDVLATHILKRTGSFLQASYAIQDTPETIAKHYGRFLPQDKAALAAQILNKVWEAA